MIFNPTDKAYEINMVMESASATYIYIVSITSFRDAAMITFYIVRKKSSISISFVHQ
jgi:hypothetical protein